MLEEKTYYKAKLHNTVKITKLERWRTDGWLPGVRGGGAGGGCGKDQN